MRHRAESARRDHSVCRTWPHPPPPAALLIGQLSSNAPFFLSNNWSGGHVAEQNQLLQVGGNLSPSRDFCFQTALVTCPRGTVATSSDAFRTWGHRCAQGTPESDSRRTDVPVQSKRRPTGKRGSEVLHRENSSQRLKNILTMYNKPSGPIFFFWPHFYLCLSVEAYTHLLSSSIHVVF